MIVEPLRPLHEAVTHEADRLVEEFHSRYGMDLTLVVIIDRGVVRVDGDCLALWGPRQMLEARLDRAGLRFETRMPGGTVIVHPAAT